jgi:hypothetical protein
MSRVRNHHHLRHCVCQSIRLPPTGNPVHPNGLATRVCGTENHQFILRNYPSLFSVHSGISEEHERGLRREGPWRQLLQLVTGEPVNCGLTSLGRLAWPLIIVNLRVKMTPSSK